MKKVAFFSNIKSWFNMDKRITQIMKHGDKLTPITKEDIDAIHASRYYDNELKQYKYNKDKLPTHLQPLDEKRLDQILSYDSSYGFKDKHYVLHDIDQNKSELMTLSETHDKRLKDFAESTIKDNSFWHSPGTKATAAAGLGFMATKMLLGRNND